MKVINALICEDVRVENNGKHILIGVFTNDVRVSGENPTVGLACWFQVEDFAPGPTELAFRITVGKRTAFEAKADVTMPSGLDRASFTIPGAAVTVTESATIKFEMKEEGARNWKTLVALPLLLNP